MWLTEFELEWSASNLVVSLSLAGIAQLVERNLAKVEVAGSNPVSRSIQLNHFHMSEYVNI